MKFILWKIFQTRIIICHLLFSVLYDTCYMPPSNLGFYTQHPQVASPSISKRRPPRATKSKSPDDGGFMLKHRPESFVSVSGGNINTMNIEQNEIVHRRNHSYQETLDLFPLHPTGILQERMETSGTATCLASTACTSSSSGSAVDRLYFDFFAWFWQVLMIHGSNSSLTCMQILIGCTQLNSM